MNLVNRLIIIGLIISKIVSAQTTVITLDERGYIVKVGDQAENFLVTLTDGTDKNLLEIKKKVLCHYIKEEGLAITFLKCGHKKSSTFQRNGRYINVRNVH